VPRETSAKRAFPLRLDPELYEALQRWAVDEFRSTNGQIEFLLHEALRRAGRLPRQRPPTSRRPEEP
jgi:hypothetical protein